MRLKTSVRLAFCAAVICLMLASCGGGGGGSATTGEAEKSQEIRTLLQGVHAVSDTLIVTGGHAVTVGTEEHRIAYNYGIFDDIRANCRGTTCTNVWPIGWPDDPFTLGDFEANDTYRDLGVHNGIPLYAGSSVDTSEGQTLELHTYGGWLDHSAFRVEGLNFGESTLINAAAMGNDTGSRPVDGSASWSGTMVGVEARNLENVRGRATVTVEFESARAGVDFTNIVNADTGARLPSMSWAGLAIGTDGRFTGGSQSGLYTPGSDRRTIVGTFFGPNHAEVAGVFERNNIAGAFGASRN